MMHGLIEIIIDDSEPVPWCYGMNAFRKPRCVDCEYDMECLALCEKLKGGD